MNNCELTKDEDGSVKQIINSRIMRKLNHEQPGDGDAVTYLVCDGQYHWAYYGWGPSVPYSKWLTEAIREKCPDFMKQEQDEFIGRHGDMECTFNNFIVADENRDAYSKVKGFRNSTLKTIVLFGATGRGKTHLAKAVQIEYLKKYSKTAFVTAASLYEIFIKAQPASREYDLEAMQQLADIREADLFILDDLGSERQTASGFFPERLQALLDERQGKMIITTNHSSYELEKRYNEKLISRIMENAITVPLRGKDHRVSR